MSKQPAPRKPLSAPPHPLAGYYHDKTGGMFWVPSKPDFALYRLDANSEPIDPESPIQNKPDEFKAALAYGTFTRINH
jgi:hypothetical protein